MCFDALFCVHELWNVYHHPFYLFAYQLLQTIQLHAINRLSKDHAKETSKVGTLIRNRILAVVSRTVVARVTRIATSQSMLATIIAKRQAYTKVGQPAILLHCLTILNQAWILIWFW